ncbi:phosphomevalonate kinase [Carnobacteriaceae bacterium zg-84]|uniref:phosphomevalonate kinase n=1 Tax=Granulicatella sp. zg-84 TaxID=2678503 RepID=UPI0013BFB10B|nr:phosphomevalonate kinase [Granulicatella sp. zg-84]NEW66567.1 phosphomevalonate kinase [Granulicatella sp. zg-84]QMI85769.1 phosphomevalonate kinase [Carnobacteriaceae bacterium zg-84]
MITVNVPGKLFIVGEYAVTSPHQPAIIAPVERFLTARIDDYHDNIIFSEQHKHTLVHFTREKEQISATPNLYPLITTAIHITESYLTITPKPFRLDISSDLDAPDGTKYGLGSSGAVTVATIKAVGAFYGKTLDNLTVYKLAVLTHLSLNSVGSFGDIATIAFGKLIAYTMCDIDWLKHQQHTCSIQEIIHQKWKDLSIECLTLPKNLSFLIGWTGTPASTELLVKEMKKQKESALYQTFLMDNKDCTNQCIQAIKEQNISVIKACIQKNRNQLQQLSRYIETPTLKTLCDIAERYGSVAKTSGAGGGDCGICLVENVQQKENIISAWNQAAILHLGEIGGNYDTASQSKR